MYKLTFDAKPEANTYVKWARGKGYMVEGPYKEKLAKNAKKKFDLNGKPKKYAFAVLRQRGAGYEGGYLPAQRRVQITEREVGTSKPAVGSTVAVVEPSVQPTTSQYKTPAQSAATARAASVDNRLSWKDWLARYNAAKADWLAHNPGKTAADWLVYHPGNPENEYAIYHMNTDPLTGHTKTPEEKAAAYAAVTAKLIPQRQLALDRANAIVAERTPQLASFLATLKAKFGSGVSLDINTGEIKGLPAGAKITQAQMWTWQLIAVNLKKAQYDQQEIQKELDALAKGERYYPPKRPTPANWKPAWEDKSLIMSREEAQKAAAGTSSQLGTLKNAGIGIVWHYNAASKNWTSFVTDESGPGGDLKKLVPGQWYAFNITKTVRIPSLGGKLVPGWYSIKWSDELGSSAVQTFGTNHQGNLISTGGVSGKKDLVFKAIANRDAATIGSMVDNPGANRQYPEYRYWKVINPSGTRQQYDKYMIDQWYTPGYLTVQQMADAGITV